MTTNHQEDRMSSSNDGPDSSTDPKERAQQVAGSAAQQSQHVAGVAQEHAKKITGEAKDQVKGLIDDASAQLDEQSRTQKSKLSKALRNFGEDLEHMSAPESDSDHAGGDNGSAQALVQQAARQVIDLAGRLDSREPQELLDDVRRFAREKPGTFLLGALLAGVVVGRLSRGAKAVKDEDGDTAGLRSEGPGTGVSTTQSDRPLPATGGPSGLDATSLPPVNVPGSDPGGLR